MPLIPILERLPWYIVSNVVSFLPTEDFVSLMQVSRDHHQELHDEFVRQHVPKEVGPRRDWRLLQMFINAVRYDSVELFEEFLHVNACDEENDRPVAFKPYEIIGKTPHFRRYFEIPLHEAIPFLPDGNVGTVNSHWSHLQFFLAKHFTYVGLATQGDAPKVLAYMYHMDDSTEINLLTQLSPLRTFAWSKCIRTIAKGLHPEALQFTKDEALHIAAKAAFPRITQRLLANGANPNRPCEPLPSPVVAHENGTAVNQGTTPTQEVIFHPTHRIMEVGTVHECPWRCSIYAVKEVLFPKATNLPLVTGCPHPRATGPGAAGGSGMCIHSVVINLTTEELATRPYRAYEGYRVYHTALRLIDGGGDSTNIPELLGIGGTHEQYCVATDPDSLVGQAHGMRAPTERYW
ncbi:hypothetical protein B0T20DRAFT_150418 [Sordaria brevicollis]|uniref:F-box domain-containing protein n=1 Tax=Sordaria brevicollis TaxID=83679 RepID=A0AAE0UDZ9_SORBR|nr:hypothetical protein B0T20DRAFT_150418 [Sordaria brevicollis]